MPAHIKAIHCLILEITVAAHLLGLGATAFQTFSGAQLPLHTQPWTLCNGNGSICVPATLPASVHTQLLASNVIPEPYWGSGDIDLRWVALEDWVFSTEFNVSDKHLQRILGARGALDNPLPAAVLEVSDVDTIAEYSLNGRVVGASDNMFRSFRFGVEQALQAGRNVLQIRLQSPILYADDQEEHSPYQVPPLGTAVDPVIHGQGNRQFIRKSQCHFGWDWGPCFATSGLFGNMTVRAISPYFESVSADVLPTDPSDLQGTWRVRVEALAQTFGSSLQDICELSVDFQNHGTYAGAHADFGSDGSVSVSFDVVNPSLWWPNGMGSQLTYDIYVHLRCGEMEVDARKLQTAFRTVQVVQTPTTGGDKFHFRVNHKDFFAKGANFIPVDSFQDRITKDQLQHILLSAQASNMNMIRNWGGGLYQSQEFFDMCDQLGILILQDFMFACAMYPTDPDFLDNVRKEVLENVRRLRHHPSIAVWAGNNENEAALVQNWYGTQSNYSLYAQDYLDLYLDVISQAVAEADPQRHYLSSSPSNGVAEKSHGFLSANPQSEYSGDVHHYDYDSDCWDVSVFPVPRFCSEYGYQSIPSVTTFQSQIPGEEMAWGSKLLEFRQHHPDGMAQMTKQIEMHYPLPNNANGTDAFQHMVYLAQIQQADCIRRETEHYRRHMGVQMEDGRGLTMGALYWQLNDIWAGPSWASIEYGGMWKALQYNARRFFKQQLVGLQVDSNATKIRVYVVTDTGTEQAMKHLSMSLTLRTFSNKIISKQDISLDAIENKAVLGDWLDVPAMLGGLPAASCVAVLEAKGSKINDPESDNVIAIEPLVPLKFTASGNFLTDPQISLKVLEQASAGAELTVIIEAKAIVPHLWVQIPDPALVWDDNDFWMLPGRKKLSARRLQDSGSEDGAFKGPITLMSMYDVMQLATVDVVN